MKEHAIPGDEGHCLFRHSDRWIVESRGNAGRTERPSKSEYSVEEYGSLTEAYRHARHDLEHRHIEDSIWTETGPLKLLKPGVPFVPLPRTGEEKNA
jgi:hypothetical protein